MNLNRRYVSGLEAEIHITVVNLPVTDVRFFTSVLTGILSETGKSTFTGPTTQTL